MKIDRKMLVVIFHILVSSAAFAESAVILKQANSPLTITDYNAVFQDESVSNRQVSAHPDQIVHWLKYTNTSSKNIVAVQIGLASFDAFNSFIGRFNGLAIEGVGEVIGAGKSKTGEWSQRPYAAFSFKNFGTGVAYVNAVRFEDGSIWRANSKEILTELQKYEKDLKAEDLIEKKSK